MFENISTIKELLDLTTKQHGDKTLFSYWEKEKLCSISYTQFSKHVTSAAKALVSKEITNRKVAVVSENSYEVVVWYFAIPLSGNILVMLDNSETIENKAYRVEHSDASCLIYSDYNKPFYEYIKENNASVIHTISIESDTKDFINFESEVQLKETDGSELSYIFYSSGTTGKPKGIMHSQINLLRTNLYFSHKFDLKGSTLLTLPLSYITSFPSLILVSMYNGVNIFISSGLKTFMTEMQEVKPYFMWTVPAVLIFFDKTINQKAKELMKTNNIDDLSARKQALEEVLGENLKLLLVGGAAFDSEFVNRMKELDVKVRNGYGMTEFCGGTITNSGAENGVGSMGSVSDNWEVKEIDGELAFKSKYMFKGYYKDPEATVNAFDGEWFLTGDAGYVEDNYVYLTGRKKNLIILANGENVSPEELEIELSKIEEIIEVLVCEQNGKLTAKVYSKDNETVIRNKINEMNRHLASYKQIQQIVFMEEEFQKTGSEKIIRGEN